MAKNKNRPPNLAKIVPVTPKLFSFVHRGLFFSGLGFLCIGFPLLLATDPGGQNWASMLSPILILLGYVLIGFSVSRPTPSSSSSSDS